MSAPAYVPQQYLLPADAATRLGLSLQTLAKWRIRGEGPVFRKHGSKVLYGVRDLDAWSDAQRRTSTSQSAEQADKFFSALSSHDEANVR